MKTYIISFLSILFLTACTVPGPSDFQSAEKPLADDEFLTIWRFSRIAKDWEVLDKSPSHKVAFETAMEPLFQQLIPRIFSDIKKGELTIRDQKEITDLDEEIIQDLPSKMNKLFEGSWQNLSPFMGTFHITQRRNLFASGFPAQELELEIIAQDPANKLPERLVGAIKVADLVERDYLIEFDGQQLGLIAYLDKIIEYAYPISYFHQGVDNGLRTLEDAFGTKKLLLQGKWASIPWIYGEPNFTGLKMTPKSKAELDPLGGLYYFPEDLSNPENNIDKNGELKVSSFSNESPNKLFYPHGKFAYLRWRYEGQSLLLFPLSNQSFFSRSGEKVRFEELEGGKMQMIIREVDGTESIFYRK